MRNFQSLDQFEFDASAGILKMTAQGNPGARLSLKLEGGYVAIAASFGPLEIALRPRLQELARVLARLRPVEGLQTTRQVGTGQAYLALGLTSDGTLLLRPTIVADATGHLSLNVAINDALRKKLFEWLPVLPETGPLASS